MSVWWVNQKNPQYGTDVKRGYRWSPTHGKHGEVIEGWRVLEDMRLGDVWICWSNQKVDALGLVNRDPEPSSDWPSDQANQNLDDYPDHRGYRVYFDRFPLQRPITAHEIPDDWKRGAGPFRKNLWVKLSSVEPVEAAAADELRRMFADRWPEESPWGSGHTDAPAPRRTRFWLNVHSADSWRRFLAGDVDVVTSSRSSQEIRRGDIFLNFVAGDGGRWVSAEEVTSEIKPLVDGPYRDYDAKWQWSIRPLTQRLSIEEAVIVRDRISGLSMFQGHEHNWGVRVRRTGSEVPECDAELIIGWIEAASEETG